MSKNKARHRLARPGPVRRFKNFTIRHARKIKFGSIGLFVAIVGYVVLLGAVNILHWPSTAAYALQAIVSIELSFVLNYLITFGDWRTKGGWRGAWLRFHSVRLFLTIPLNQVLFNILVWLGGWLVTYTAFANWEINLTASLLHTDMNTVILAVANTICIVTTTIVNYLIAKKYIFKKIQDDLAENVNLETMPLRVIDSLPVLEIPFSVVIPTKNVRDGVSDTVRIVKTVEALIAQDYPLPLEIIVVGDIDDAAWLHLERFDDRIRRFAAKITSPGRDSNLKRAIGLDQASLDSEILAVMDDDVIPPPAWASTVAHRLQLNIHAVAGPVNGLGISFWTRYIDRNPVASKMPRIKGRFVVNQRRLRYRKPPVTANFAITRKLYKAVGGPDPAFTNSYEDYSWMSYMTQRSYGILCDERLVCKRYHREGLRPLIREYQRSGKGCADLVSKYFRSCTFAKKRVRQVLTFYSLAMTGVAALILSPLPLLLVGFSASLALAIAIATKVGHREGLVYPFISLLLGTMFVIGFTRRIITSRGLIMPTLHDLRYVPAANIKTLPIKTIRLGDERP